MRVSKGAQRASAEILVEMLRRGDSVSREGHASAVDQLHGKGVNAPALSIMELEFFSRSLLKGMKLYRSGWPDFLVEVKGKTIGIEVKSDSDTLRKQQKVMFDALERAGIPIYVWWSRFPERLIPWRKLARLGPTKYTRQEQEKADSKPSGIRKDLSGGSMVGTSASVGKDSPVRILRPEVHNTPRRAKL